MKESELDSLRALSLALFNYLLAAFSKMLSKDVNKCAQEEKEEEKEGQMILGKVLSMKYTTHFNTLMMAWSP